MKFSFVLLCLGLLLSCSNADTKVETAAESKPVAFVSKNSNAFNQPFEHLLSTYYLLSDAFVEYDTARINTVSQELAADAGSLELSGLSDDSSGAVKAIALRYTDTIKSFSGKIASQADFIKKQRSFQTISGAMYELVRTVKYDRQKIYHQHCPMAFNNEGAFWISNSNEIVNPFMGKKHPKYRSSMLECGTIPDSLDFSK